MNENLRLLSRIFGRCTIFGIVVLLIWVIVCMLPGDFICSMHSRLFNIEPHECTKMLYGFMGLMKILVIVLFFFPWLAIQFEIRSRK